jgi:hypothetical protein
MGRGTKSTFSPETVIGYEPPFSPSYDPVLIATDEQFGEQDIPVWNRTLDCRYPSVYHW